jgi:cellulose synthase/poly-beta-1,6-N-acetylglucosamine synthase-like glycosyltransferase
LPQATRIVYLKAAKAFAPGVDRLFAVVPLSETHMAGRPRTATIASSSRTTRGLGNDLRQTGSASGVGLLSRHVTRKVMDRSQRASDGNSLKASRLGRMVIFLSCFLMVIATLLAIPVTIFLLEIIAAIALPRNRIPPPLSAVRPRIAVLVPAHNESSGLLPTLADIRAQLGERDRLIVVADNCSDDTAAFAAASNAEVVVRNEPDKIGKSYALAWGVTYLQAAPPDVVIMIDADCRLADDAINRLAAACAVTRRPAQALYLMTAADETPINFKVAEFAWRIKNWVRPLGLRVLGLPCQLLGSGMAFPWGSLLSIELATGSIVEDLKLGLDLTEAGSPPIFWPFPCVTSKFPMTVEGAQSQRQRWEQGQIGALVTMVPRLLLSAAARADLNLLVLALDAAIPPISLLATLVLVTLSPGSIVLIFPYIWTKLYLYRKILSSRFDLQWVRTDRRRK